MSSDVLTRALVAGNELQRCQCPVYLNTLKLTALSRTLSLPQTESMGEFERWMHAIRRDLWFLRPTVVVAFKSERNINVILDRMGMANDLEHRYA